jgi:hypothetical protein
MHPQSRSSSRERSPPSVGRAVPATVQLARLVIAFPENENHYYQFARKKPQWWGLPFHKLFRLICSVLKEFVIDHATPEQKFL